MSGRGWQAAWRADPARWSAVIVVLVALAASVSGLGNGFAYDDHPIIVENPRVQQFSAVWDYFTTSYWGPSRGNSLYRPITVILFALQRVAGGGSPLPFHIANVALYVASCVAVLVLARAMLPAGAALLAAVLWAAHPVHVESVANVVGQSEMLVAIPLLLAVALYLRDRARGPLRDRTALTIASLYAFGLLCKENAIVLPGLLLAAELAFGRADGSFAPRAAAAKSLRQLASVLGLVTILFLLVRSAVLNGVLGDLPHPALEGLSHGERLWVVLGLLPEVARLLVWPARLYADYSPDAVPVLASPSAGHIAGAALLVAYVAALAWAWRRERSGVLVFALAWVPITYALVSNVLFATGVMIAERTLFLPTVGAALAAGWCAAALTRVLAARPPATVAPARTALVALAVGVVTFGTVRSAFRQPVWQDNATLFATTVVEAPGNFRAHNALGVLFGAAGEWERAEYHLRIADSLFPEYDLIELSLARTLHFDDRCPEAILYYDRVLAKRPDTEVALVGRSACLLEVRRLSDARRDAVHGIASGQAVDAFRLILQKAESSLAANDTIDARNRWARAGRPTSQSNARLRVPVLLRRNQPVLMRRNSPESVPDSAAP